jgi:hypothetical protein
MPHNCTLLFGALAVCAQAKLEANATAPKANSFFISVFFMACISFCGWFGTDPV